MKIIKLWIFPLALALLAVLLLRLYLYSFYVVQSDNMNNTLFANDIVLIQKYGKIKHSNIVLINQNNKNTLSRCVARPGDTLKIKSGIIYINRHKLKYKKHPKPAISYEYIFKTDSSNLHLADTDKIYFDKNLALFGVYHFNTDINTINKLSKLPYWYSKKKRILPQAVYDRQIQPFITRFYWNKDNTGSIIIPAKNMKIKLTAYNYELYKFIIKKETGKTLERNNNTVYLNKKPIETYVFRNNYYFVINDNRRILNDSRNQGFINEKQIEGKVLFKLPDLF